MYLDKSASTRTKSLVARGLSLAALVLLAAFVVAYLAMGRAPQSLPVLTAGFVVPEPRSITPFTLQDQHGNAFTRASFDGRWSVLFTGFTSCPDICPTTLVTLAHLEERMQEAGHDLQFVFLSLDPERDTPAVLAPYLAHYSARFAGVTGDSREIDALMASLGLAYIKVPLEGERYTIDHSAALVLIDPQARVAAYFRPPLHVAAIAADLLPLLPDSR